MEHDLSLEEILVAIVVGLIICAPFGLILYFTEPIQPLGERELTHKESVRITQIAEHPEMQPIIKEANEDYINLEEYREITDKYDKLIIEKSVK